MNNLSLMQQAKEFRSQGLSLDKITTLLKQPRSTVYYWIRKIPLTAEQQQQLEIKRQAARKKGSIAWRNRRLDTIERYKQQGISDIKKISNRELLIIGSVLYWAEGSKQKENNVSQGIEFSNQDPRMMATFCKWLDVLEVSPKDRQFTLYIHKQHQWREAVIKSAWEHKLHGQIKKWETTILKKHNTTHRINGDYIGLLRVRINRSSDLNRKVSGWINAIYSLTRV